ncbi:RING finger protein 208 [Nematolebias whitei]|uniref:RING finger protein 208 n=1 Tax=Nematolebias whitei TaxID=451745 RepID=UPI001897159D|nr:RING finger protein 208 [Nematolebias whitei]
MVLCEDGECSVCLLPYSRTDRIPRVLHCLHTFCEPCLKTISQVRGGLVTVPCPLCRRVTCIGRGLGLQEALWVNDKLWEKIPEEEHAEEEDGERTEIKQQPSFQAECVSARPAAARLKLPAFFRKFSLTKPQQDRIIPGSNVEMKSWRRLSADETV